MDPRVNMKSGVSGVFPNESEKSGVLQNSGVMISSRRSQEV